MRCQRVRLGRTPGLGVPTCKLMITPKHIDWNALRKDFPILDQQVHGQPLIYFDNAATSQKPHMVINALVHYYEHDNANVHRGIHELSNRATSAYEAGENLLDGPHLQFARHGQSRR